MYRFMLKAYINSLNLMQKVTDHLETEDEAQVYSKIYT